MESLQITAYLATSLVTSDDWTPNIDSILTYIKLKQRGLLKPNVQTAKDITPIDIPIKTIHMGRYKFYSVSSPIYQRRNTSISRFRSRWDYQEYNLNWGKKKAKVNTGEGNTKSYDLPMRVIETPRIDWFCIGDRSEITQLLNSCTHLNKKASQGKGQIARWEVKEIKSDRSITHKDKLLKVIPVEAFEQLPNKNNIVNVKFLEWSYRPPYYLSENKTLCAMPIL